MPLPCPRCGPITTPRVSTGYVPCPLCKGSRSFGDILCWNCGGSGRVRCAVCGGSGEAPQAIIPRLEIAAPSITYGVSLVKSFPKAPGL